MLLSVLVTMLVSVLVSVPTAVLGGVVGVTSASASPRAPHAAHTQGPRTVEAYATYYGWYTNTPPGCATAYSGCAGGVGTATDPITLASSAEELPVGTLVYYPTLEKYFVMGDDCSECDADWTGKGPDGGPHFWHFDLWMGGKGGREQALVGCEDALTQSTPTGRPLDTRFVLNPPRGLPVSAEPLFDPASSRCFTGGPRTAVVVRGHLVNAQSGTCMLAPTGRAAHLVGDHVRTGPCRSGPSDTVSLAGDSLSARGVCLATTGKLGSLLVWARCTGGPLEQWEMGADGSVVWVQYLRCAVARRPLVVLSSCHAGSRAARWTLEP